MADLLAECIEDISPGNRDAKAFQETFCARCRNPVCVNAKWAQDKFGARVSTQMDRLFKSPQANPKDPKYALIADFKSLLQEAMKLEISSRRNDWEIPEIPIVDGQIVTARPSSTQAVDDAVRSLAKAKGQEPPVLIDPRLAQKDEFVEEAIKELPPPPEPVEKPKTVQPESPKNLPPQVPAQRGNTPRQAGGVVIGGGAPPTLKPPIADSWAPPAPKESVVAVGATVRMGGGKKTDG